MSQKSAFLQGEGDAYFQRNEGVSHPFIAEIFRPYCKGRTLEIGCGGGFNLNALAGGFGIDPSAKAIESGRKRFPHLSLSVGTADHLEFPAHHFDTVLFGFCLYLIDREDLPKVVSETSRVLKPGGFLGLWDFDPPKPVKREYKHREGVWSYKMDYSQLFLPSYTLVEKRPFSHAGMGFVSDPQERVAAWVLLNAGS